MFTKGHGIHHELNWALILKMLKDKAYLSSNLLSVENLEAFLC
jgi:hypothetical protein